MDMFVLVFLSNHAHTNTSAFGVLTLKEPDLFFEGIASIYLFYFTIVDSYGKIWNMLAKKWHAWQLTFQAFQELILKIRYFLYLYSTYNWYILLDYGMGTSYIIQNLHHILP